MKLLFWRKPRIPVLVLHGILARRAALNIAAYGPLIDRARALELGLIDGLGDTATLIRDLGGDRARPHPFAPRRRGLLSRLPRMLAEAEAELHAPRLRL